jgi:hypothetical protein
MKGLHAVRRSGDLISCLVNNAGGGVGDAVGMRSPIIFSRRLLLSLVLPALLALLAVPVSLSQTPATILLIRHGEKPETGIHLSPAGVERAKAIPQLFGGLAPHNLPKPDFLFATKAGKNSDREVDTLLPLSEAMKMPIGHEVADKEFATLATELLSGKYAGKVVLVCWHHGSLPEFATALGAALPYDKWPDTQFDRIWRIDYVNGKAMLTDLPEGLLPGDSK